MTFGYKCVQHGLVQDRCVPVGCRLDGLHATYREFLYNQVSETQRRKQCLTEGTCVKNHSPLVEALQRGAGLPAYRYSQS